MTQISVAEVQAELRDMVTTTKGRIDGNVSMGLTSIANATRRKAILDACLQVFENFAQWAELRETLTQRAAQAEASELLAQRHRLLAMALLAERSHFEGNPFIRDRGELVGRATMQIIAQQVPSDTDKEGAIAFHLADEPEPQAASPAPVTVN